MRTSRRAFLGLLGGAAAGAALSRTPFGDAFRSPTSPPEPRPRGEEYWTNTTCTLCPAGCGIRARIVDGRVVKIDGNPDHPVNRGGVCALGQSGTHVLYHPDRLEAPQVREGGRSGKWRRITWDEAHGILATKLRELRTRGTPNHLLILDGTGEGTTSNLLGRFARVYGTPHRVKDRVPDAMEVAMELSQGISTKPGYDLDHAALVLSFGSPLLESWISPLQAQRAYATAHRDRKPRGRWIQVDTRFSPTAAKADQFISVRPGTHGALALALAYVLVREEIYDSGFIEKHTTGFNDAQDAAGREQMGFRSFLLRSCHPDALSSVCGVPVDQILRLAKEFATTRPAIALADHGATLHGNGVFTALAVHALNALSGSLDTPGGILTPYAVPWGAWPEPALDPVATLGLESRRLDGAGSRFPLGRDAIAAVPDGLQDARVEIAILVRSNPMVTTPDPDRFVRALSGIPFVVSIASHMDETVDASDLVLPEPTYLESTDAIAAPPSLGVPIASYQQPVVPPHGDVRTVGDSLIALAHAVGEPLAGAFPWKEHREAVRESVRGLFESRRGTILVDERSEAQVRELERRGWWVPTYTTFEEFETAFTQKGGWWDPNYGFGEWTRVFQTPSRKFEFRSSRLEEMVDRLLQQGGRGTRREDVLASLGIRVRGEEATLPHYEEPIFTNPAEPDRSYLEPINPLTLGSVWLAGLPWLQDQLEPYGQAAWDSWIEINTEDAARLGLRHGDRVKVHGSAGTAVGIALVLPTAAPGLALWPVGYGRHAGTSGAATRGENPLRLVEARFEGLAGIPHTLSTRVRIERLPAAEESHG